MSELRKIIPGVFEKGAAKAVARAVTKEMSLIQQFR